MTMISDNGEINEAVKLIKDGEGFKLLSISLDVNKSVYYTNLQLPQKA